METGDWSASGARSARPARGERHRGGGAGAGEQATDTRQSRAVGPDHAPDHKVRYVVCFTLPNVTRGHLPPSRFGLRVSRAPRRGRRGRRPDTTDRDTARRCRDARERPSRRDSDCACRGARRAQSTHNRKPRRGTSRREPAGRPRNVTVPAASLRAPAGCAPPPREAEAICVMRRTISCRCVCVKARRRVRVDVAREVSAQLGMGRSQVSSPPEAEAVGAHLLTGADDGAGTELAHGARIVRVDRLR